MISLEKKTIEGNTFFYLTEQIRVANKFKKNQVYLGKNIPKNLQEKYNELEKKETALIKENIERMFEAEPIIPFKEIEKIEILRINWKFFLITLTKKQQERLWINFAIQFIFESNAIEGSRLSQEEVSSILNKKYIKKSIQGKELQEVKNAIKAFDLIRSKAFSLNERSLISLHKLVTENLDIKSGYKKEKIIVNNKETVPPGEVRSSITSLISWWKKQKRTNRHFLFLAADFHAKFEFIHPFTDGNGRVGRLLFSWMLIQSEYGVLLFKNKNRQAYFSALNQADEGRLQKWHWHCLDVYKMTMKDVLKKT